MEDSLKLLPESEDDSRETPLAKKRKTVGSFLSGWRQLQGEETEKHHPEIELENDEEEEDTPGPTPKKFKRQFRNLFPMIVERLDSTKEPSKIEGNPPRERLPSGFFLPTIELTRPKPEETIAEAVEPVATSETTETRETVTPSPEIKETETSEAVEPDLEPGLDAGEPMPPEPPAPEHGDYGGGSMGSSFRRPESLPPAPVEKPKETPEIPYYKHGNVPAWLAFLGGEFLSRGRDRKLRKENKRLAHEQETIQIQQAEILKRQLKAEKQQKTQAEELVKVEKQPQKPDRTSPAEKSLPTEPLAVSKTPELIITPELHPEHYKELSQHDRAEILPQNVLEQVEVAADKNIAIESLYERRHEIKDEDKALATPKTVLFGEQTASPVSEILASPEFDKARLAAGQSKADNPAVTKQLYSQAVKTGFIVAMSIIFIVCIYLLFR